MLHYKIVDSILFNQAQCSVIIPYANTECYISYEVMEPSQVMMIYRSKRCNMWFSLNTTQEKNNNYCSHNNKRHKSMNCFCTYMYLYLITFATLVYPKVTVDSSLLFTVKAVRTLRGKHGIINTKENVLVSAWRLG